MRERLFRVLVVAFTAGASGAAASPAEPLSGLGDAFKKLRTYSWGTDRSILNPLDEAVRRSWKNKAMRGALEKRLVRLLSEKLPNAAKDYICRKLSLIGTAASVPALAALLSDPASSDIARYAVERIPGPEALAALRKALRSAPRRQKIGIINSLGVRRDREALPLLQTLLRSKDLAVVRAALAAVGSIGTAASGTILRRFSLTAPKSLILECGHARLLCAERLLKDGEKAGAIALYSSLVDPSQPARIRNAALRGLKQARGGK